MIFSPSIVRLFPFWLFNERMINSWPSAHRLSGVAFDNVLWWDTALWGLHVLYINLLKSSHLKNVNCAISLAVLLPFTIMNSTSGASQELEFCWIFFHIWSIFNIFLIWRRLLCLLGNSWRCVWSQFCCISQYNSMISVCFLLLLLFLFLLIKLSFSQPVSLFLSHHTFSPPAFSPLRKGSERVVAVEFTCPSG